MDWGVVLGLRPCQISYRATLHRAVHVRVTVGAQRSAFVAVARATPLSRGSGVRVTASEALLCCIGGKQGLDAFARGVHFACEHGVTMAGRRARHDEDSSTTTGARLRLPIVDVEVELLGVEHLELEAAAQSLYAAAAAVTPPKAALLLAAGARCLRRAFFVASGVSRSPGAAASCGARGGGPPRVVAAEKLRVLEPLQDVFVQVPQKHTRAVIRDLLGRGGRICKVHELRPLLFSVEATVPLRRLRRYGRRLAALTSSTATYATGDGGYAEVPDLQGAGLAALLRGAQAAGSARRSCPLMLWNA